MLFEQTTLGDVSKGGKGYYGIAASAVDYSDELYTYLRITDIKDDGTIDFGGLKSVNDGKAANYVLQPNDIVFARTGASTGRNYFYDGSDGQFVYAGFLIKFSIDPDKVNPRYVKYYCLSQEYKGWIVSYNTGSTRGNINAQTLAQMPLLLPERTQQDKMVDILSSIDRKIKENEKINKNLEQQAQALYRSWFVNYEPFGGTKPADWINGSIDDLGSEIICGKTPSTKKTEYYGGSTPFITIPDMHGCVYTVSTERYLSAAGVASQSKKTIPRNSVCVSCIGTAGLVTLVSEESQTNQQINSIVHKEGVSTYYTYLLMQTLSETINKLGQSGSTIVNLNKTQFGKIPVIVPSKHVSQEFDSLCRPLFEKILLNQKENIKLSALRDTLLPKLMSGEIDFSTLDL